LCVDCEHHKEKKEKKMDFFEARNKAEFGDSLKWSGSSGNWAFVVVNDEKLLWKGGSQINQNILFKKEWIIIPKKKEVIIDIPEGAENIRMHCESGVNYAQDTLSKITYLIEEK
jgi:hypothetical protein